MQTKSNRVRCASNSNRLFTFVVAFVAIMTFAFPQIIAGQDFPSVIGEETFHVPPLQTPIKKKSVLKSISDIFTSDKNTKKLSAGSQSNSVEKVNGKSNTGTTVGKVNSTDRLFQVGYTTTWVIVGVVVLILLLKKGGLQKFSTFGKTAPPSKINIVETKRLSARSTLNLIEVDDRQFLVAMEGISIKSVDRIDSGFTNFLESDEGTTSETEDQSISEEDLIAHLQAV